MWRSTGYMATATVENEFNLITPRRRAGDDAPDYALHLERDLRKHIEGEVRFDAGSRALYSTDGSNYRQVPIGVVIPKSFDDVLATIAACRGYGAPVLA